MGTAPEIREDLAAAQRDAVEHWGRPGAWWTGSERLAMVTECRRARAGDLPAWVAPTTVDGLIDADHVLPGAAIDAVWRLSCGPGTLTHEWHQGILERGLSPLSYLELVAVVASSAAVDTFATALGHTPPPLGEAESGSAHGESVPDAEVRAHWVPTTPANGPNVFVALSAARHDQEMIRRLVEAHYLPADALMGDLEWSRGTLDRMQIELLAARTSALNECFY
ncbi:MAG: alkylhydroperoxidase-related (seleno)protein [Acidimicrobiales bacterium]